MYILTPPTVQNMNATVDNVDAKAPDLKKLKF